MAIFFITENREVRDSFTYCFTCEESQFEELCLACDEVIGCEICEPHQCDES